MLCATESNNTSLPITQTIQLAVAEVLAQALADCKCGTAGGSADARAVVPPRSIAVPTGVQG